MPPQRPRVNMNDGSPPRRDDREQVRGAQPPLPKLVSPAPEQHTPHSGPLHLAWTVSRGPKPITKHIRPTKHPHAALPVLLLMAMQASSSQHLCVVSPRQSSPARNPGTGRRVDGSRASPGHDEQFDEADAAAKAALEQQRANREAARRGAQIGSA